jgi:hypothetical protein
MMTWNYRVFRENENDYVIREVFYGEDGTILGCTADAVEPFGQSLDELARELDHLLTEEEVAQVICYLAATDLKVGLLLNFGRKRLQYKRILQPRDVAGWPDRIQRYLWNPKL